MPSEGRYAVVTPYYREERATLERCIASVKRQTVAADHILVSDGFPQDWLDEAGVIHIRLGHAHADYGNTPRGLGALLAIADRVSAVCFLDADNWLDPGHTEICAAVANADVVIAKRRFVRYDGSVIAKLADEPHHADTSCFWLNRGAFHLAHHWLMPRELAPLCDRVFYDMLKAKRVPLAYTEQITVNYTCQYEPLYRAVGEEPPPGAKPAVDMRPVYEWLRGLDPEKRRLVEKQCGVDLVPKAAAALRQADGTSPFEVSRNDPCPCGSGQKYRNCHGAIA